MFTLANLVLLMCAIVCFESCASSIPSTYRHVLPRQSFVKVEKSLVVHSCANESCTEESFSAVASGVVVQNTLKGAYVLTAAHVCDESDIFKQFSYLPKLKIDVKFFVITLEEDKKLVQIVDYNVEHDVCVVWVENLFAQPVAISPSAPVPGDLVLNIAAPLGVFSKNMVPIFQGVYSGIDEEGRAVYTLPAFGGSSGSPILNSKGELIGMVHSTLRYFNHIAISPSYKAMREFLNTTIDRHMYYRFFRTLWRPFMWI